MSKKIDIDKDKLYDLYICQHKTANEIANIFECSSVTIGNYLSKYNIYKQNNNNYSFTEKRKFDHKVAIRLYTIYEKTVNEIAEILNVKETAVRKCFKKNNVELIPCSYQHHYRNLTGQTINNLLFIKDSGKRAKGGNVLWEIKCYCGEIFLTRAARIIHGVTTSCGCYRSKVCSERASARIGSLHPLWNKDKSHIKTCRRIGMDVWRCEVFKRDNYKCQICYKKGNLNAHHLNGYHWCIEERCSIDNGITLCFDHHNEFHNKYGRGNNTKQQFEEFLKRRRNE